MIYDYMIYAHQVFERLKDFWEISACQFDGNEFQKTLWGNVCHADNIWSFCEHLSLCFPCVMHSQHCWIVLAQLGDELSGCLHANTRSNVDTGTSDKLDDGAKRGISEVWLALERERLSFCGFGLISSQRSCACKNFSIILHSDCQLTPVYRLMVKLMLLLLLLVYKMQSSLSEIKCFAWEHASPVHHRAKR